MKLEALPSYGYLALLTIIGTLGGCSLEPFSKHALLRVELPPVPVEVNLTPENTGPSILTAPATASLFNCLAVNVMGPGIIDTEKGFVPTARLNSLLSGASFCAYPGITTPPISNTGGSRTATLAVPTGPTRLIQMIGIMQGNTSICSSGGPIGNTPSGNNDTDEYYEIGRSILDLFTDREVSIGNFYDGAANKDIRRLNCGHTTLSIASAEYKSVCVPNTAVVPDAEAFGGTVLSPDNYSVEDSTYSTSELMCADNMNQLFGFSTTSVTLSQYTSIRVRWRGIAGQFDSPCTNGISGGGQVRLWNGTTNQWTTMGSTASASDQTVDVSLSGLNLSEYPFNDQIFINVSGPAGGAGCSKTSTDYIKVTLEGAD